MFVIKMYLAPGRFIEVILLALFPSLASPEGEILKALCIKNKRFSKRSQEGCWVSKRLQLPPILLSPFLLCIIPVPEGPSQSSG